MVIAKIRGWEKAARVSEKLAMEQSVAVTQPFETIRDAIEFLMSGLEMQKRYMKRLATVRGAGRGEEGRGGGGETYSVCVVWVFRSTVDGACPAGGGGGRVFGHVHIECSAFSPGSPLLRDGLSKPVLTLAYSQYRPEPNRARSMLTMRGKGGFLCPACVCVFVNVSMIYTEALTAGLTRLSTITVHGARKRAKRNYRRHERTRSTGLRKHTATRSKLEPVLL